ncbi:hypothetical protein Tco_1304370 [Tanacetum coccineum]
MLSHQGRLLNGEFQTLGIDLDDEDEDEEEEHLALADSAVVVPTVELVSPPEGTKPVIPPPSTGHVLPELGLLSGFRLPYPFHQRQRIASTQALIDAVTAALQSPPLPPLPPLPPSLYILPHVDHRDDVPESELPPRKRLCLSTLGLRYEIRESSTARPIRGRGIDYGFVSTVVEEEAYASREAWAHAIVLSQAVHSELQTHREQVYAHESQLHAHQTQLQLQETDHRRQIQMAETLRVMRDMRLEIGDMQAELLALRGQNRRARQPRSDARAPDHHDATRDADSHI